MEQTTKLAPRGIRNNNPLNIRRGSDWQGMRAKQIDPDFVQFESMTMGLRAAFVLLRNYMLGHTSTGVRYDTLTTIINRWAPSSENNTSKYIAFVERHTDIDRRETLYFNNRSKMIVLVRAMAAYECGRWLDVEMIRSAYDLLCCYD